MSGPHSHKKSDGQIAVQDNQNKPPPAWPLDFPAKMSSSFSDTYSDPFGPNHVNNAFAGQASMRPESSMSNASFMTPGSFANGGGVPLHNAGTQAPHSAASSTDVASGLHIMKSRDVMAQRGFGLGINNSGRSEQAFPLPNRGLAQKANTFQNTTPMHNMQGMTGPMNGIQQPWPLHPSNMPWFSQSYHVPDLSHVSAKAAKAKALAAMIMSGACSTPDDWEIINNQSRRSSSAAHQTNGTRVARSCSQASLTQSPTKTANAATHGGNTKGNAAVFIDVNMLELPPWFDRLTFGYKPTVKEVLDHLPFVEGCRSASPSNAGVVRICNIPFNTPRSELTAFVGRNARVLSQPHGSPYFAVHVIMERHSGKTMDAFIELASQAEAVTVVNQFMRRMGDGRPPRIGDRAVCVELSSQEALMLELFPRAKRTSWVDGIPHINTDYMEFYPGILARGYNGFLQDEELVMMVRHVESPNRSPFVARCPVRAYESLISTIYKYPWFAVDHVYISERRALFDATLTTIRSLINYLRRGDIAYDPIRPTIGTLQELMVACLTCPGFSEQQKMSMIMLVHHGGFGQVTVSRGMNLVFGGNFPMASVWPFQVLIKAPGANNQFMEYVAWLMREAINTTNGSVSADFKTAHGAGGRSLNAMAPFGEVHIEYGNSTTIGDIGRIELRYIENLFGRVLRQTDEVTLSTTNSSPVRQTRNAWSPITRVPSQGSCTTYSA